MSLKRYLPDNPAIAVIKRFQVAAPVDVVRLAEELGIAVFEDALTPFISGKLFHDVEDGGHADFSMIVRAADPLVRKRFTVAHEIAHFLLHRHLIGSELEDSALYRSKLSDKVEQEANRLAAEILMPVSLVQEALNKPQTYMKWPLSFRFPRLPLRLGWVSRLKTIAPLPAQTSHPCDSSVPL